MHPALLEQPGTRLVSLEGTWSSPTHGAGRWREWLDGTTRALHQP